MRKQKQDIYENQFRLNSKHDLIFQEQDLTLKQNFYPSFPA
jgi:hypothetical protein